MTDIELSKGRSVSKHYEFHSEYNTLEAAQKAILDGFGDGIEWRFYKQTPNTTGSIHWYRCKVSHLCPRLQLKHNSVIELYTIHRNEAEHDHAESSKAAFGIDTYVKKYIDNYERLGLKPTAMLRSLRPNLVSSIIRIQTSYHDCRLDSGFKSN